MKRERAANGAAVYNDGEGSRNKKARLTQPSVPRPCIAPIIQIPSAPVLHTHAQMATPITTSLSSALQPLSPSIRTLTPILPPSTSEQPTSAEITPPPQAGALPVRKLSGTDANIPVVAGQRVVSVTPISLIASNADASRNTFTDPLTADRTSTEDNTPPSTHILVAALVLPVEPSVTAPLLVPCSPKPPGSDTRLTTPASSSSSSKTTEALAHTGINKMIKVKNPFTAFNQPSVTQSSTSPDTSIKATAESTPITQPTSSNAVASGSSNSTAQTLAQKRSKLLAKHKYKANVISTQNIFLANWLQDNPEGQYHECTKAYGTLSSDEIKELKEECSNKRIAKTSTQTTSFEGVA